MAKTIKSRAKASGGEVTVKALISHPMETGLRKNKKTGKNFPAHFIQEVTASANGKQILVAEWGGAVSKNPYLSFKYSGKAGDKVTISWVDNKGEKDSATTSVR
ncbi:MAG: thiosulfate oxidation carrier complex protein SoxZ [Gammaproteobacteria bacterium]|nr:thiosulfate oxidation carrier complex protein SoxZ [Gammaproteobacteria bacterium]